MQGYRARSVDDSQRRIFLSCFISRVRRDSPLELSISRNPDSLLNRYARRRQGAIQASYLERSRHDDIQEASSNIFRERLLQQPSPLRSTYFASWDPLCALGFCLGHFWTPGPFAFSIAVSLSSSAATNNRKVADNADAPDLSHSSFFKQELWRFKTVQKARKPPTSFR